MLPTGHQAYHSLCTSIRPPGLTVFISTMGPLQAVPHSTGGTPRPHWELGGGPERRICPGSQGQPHLGPGGADTSQDSRAGQARPTGTNQPLPLPAGGAGPGKEAVGPFLPMLIETVQLRIFKAVVHSSYSEGVRET